MEKNSHQEAWQKLDVNGKRMVIREYLSRVVILLILFVISGNWTWLGAWITFAFALVSIILVHSIVVRANPDLYNERGAKHSDTKKWDTVLLPLYGLCGYLVLIIPSIDERLHWSDLPSYFV